VPADSTQATTYINQLSYTTNKNFVDDITDFGASVLTVTIRANGEDDLVLTGYNIPGKDLILNSSLNPEAYFSDKTLADKFLKGKNYFLTDNSSL